MTELSPAAQAVMDAYVDEDRAGRLAVAAAIRAAADQPYKVPAHVQGEAYWAFRDGADAKRSRILAIAAELEGHHG